MERFNRAERRAQTARIKRNRKNYWGRDAFCDDPLTPRQLGIVAQTPHICSCLLGCANSRKFYGRTLAEVCNEIDEKEGLQELDE